MPSRRAAAFRLWRNTGAPHSALPRPKCGKLVETGAADNLFAGSRLLEAIPGDIAAVITQVRLQHTALGQIRLQHTALGHSSETQLWDKCSSSMEREGVSGLRGLAACCVGTG